MSGACCTATLCPHGPALSLPDPSGDQLVQQVIEPGDQPFPHGKAVIPGQPNDDGDIPQDQVFAVPYDRQLGVGWLALPSRSVPRPPAEAIDAYQLPAPVVFLSDRLMDALGLSRKIGIEGADNDPHRIIGGEVQ